VLPFGWSRSGYWFCRLVNRFWTIFQQRYRYRVCSYVDDFAVMPSVGRPATEADSLKASAKLGQLLVKYGLTRHRDKGVWNGGAQVLSHLGFIIDTVRGVFGVPPTKLGKMEALARRFYAWKGETHDGCQQRILLRLLGEPRACGWRSPTQPSV
jgi:hypothetical protein